MTPSAVAGVWEVDDRAYEWTDTFITFMLSPEAKPRRMEMQLFRDRIEAVRMWIHVDCGGASRRFRSSHRQNTALPLKSENGDILLPSRPSTPFARFFRHGSAGLLHRHILIADDDRAIRGLLQLVAERQGFTVDAVADGLEAVQHLEERQYDLAIIDLMMPRLSGYEVVEQLARKTTRPVVVVVSAMTDTYVSDLDSGVVHSIIRKPFDVALIGDLMSAIVRRPAGEPQEQAAADAAALTNLLDFPETVC